MKGAKHLPDKALAKIIDERIVTKQRREKKRGKERSLEQLTKELGWD